MTVPGASGTLELGPHSDIAVNFDLAPWRWPAGSSTSELKSTQLQSPLSTEPFLIVCTTELSDVGTQLSRPATWASEAPAVCLPRGGCPGQADFGISLLCACTNAIPWGCGWTVSIFLHWRYHNLRSSWIWASFMGWLFFFLNVPIFCACWHRWEGNERASTRLRSAHLDRSRASRVAQHLLCVPDKIHLVTLKERNVSGGRERLQNPF